ncbi:unnamed protein product [Cochlearia groenlandica]
MSTSFNTQILMEKLAKLNSSQASIETLSHWCIFHINKAKHVVETWGRQFHCAPHEQRLAYLYLANDILLNSRRRGSEFVGEFWKVLPEALRDVIENGDDFARKSARRLVNIWEDRKVFGSSGQILKEEFLGRQLENGTRNGIQVPIKLRQEAGTTLERVVSAVEALHSVQIDEDVIVGKCNNAACYLEITTLEVERRDLSSGHTPSPAVVKEVDGQHAVLRDCIEQLEVMETSRTSLVSHLREALQEQLNRYPLYYDGSQIARFQSDKTGDLCKQLQDHGDRSHLPPVTGQEVSKEVIKGSLSAAVAAASQDHEEEQSAPVMFEEDTRKTAAAAVVAQLTASTSSAEMLSYVISSLASQGVIKNNSSDDNPPEKRPKLLQNHDQFQLQPHFLQPLQPPGLVNHTPYNYTVATTCIATQQQGQEQEQEKGHWVNGVTPLTTTTSEQSDSSYQKFQGQDGFYGMNLYVPVTRQ